MTALVRPGHVYVADRPDVWHGEHNWHLPMLVLERGSDYSDTFEQHRWRVLIGDDVVDNVNMIPGHVTEVM